MAESKGRAYLLIPAAGLVGLGLVVQAVDGARAIDDRRSLPWSVEPLECIQTEIERITSPGDTLRIESDGDPFLLQRTTEIAYPRVNLTVDQDADALVVRWPAPTERITCGLYIAVER